MQKLAYSFSDHLNVEMKDFYDVIDYFLFYRNKDYYKWKHEALPNFVQIFVETCIGLISAQSIVGKIMFQKVWMLINWLK